MAGDVNIVSGHNLILRFSTH